MMQQLRKLGTAQNVKVYRRHGCGENVYGVSFAHLKRLARQLGLDHELAAELWSTENSDARSLAMMIADPDQLTASQADAWCRSVTYHLHAGELAGVVARSNLARSKRRIWCRRRAEMVRTAGYALVGAMLKSDPETLTLNECREVLESVANEVHASPNRARHTMVQAVIAIAAARPELADEAIAIGERIGTVHVDHGETSCQTPQIVPSIRKILSSPGRTRLRHGC